MKAGDVIQIRQHDNLHDASQPVADPPIHKPGPIDFWIYADVLELLPENKLRVRVNHPGNALHGSEQIVAPLAADDKGNPVINVRTKADVEELAGAAHHSNPAWNAKLQQHYKTQAERLVTQA